MLTDRQKAVSDAADRAGHPNWAGLPMTRREAQGLGKTYYFTGRPCTYGHIARRITLTDKCEYCALPRVPDKSTEQIIWEDRFSHLADKIEATGRLHYYKKGNSFDYRVVETDRVVPDYDNLRAACAKAAKFTARDGVLRCVVPGATRWVVKTSA